MNDLISRQEAIEAAEKGCLELKGVFERVKDNLKALPSANVCTDAISRQAAIDAFEKRAHIDWEHLKVLDPLLEEIDDLPSVGVEEKVGKWILTIEDWNKWTCSECGYYERTDIHVSLGWKYCPSCGAKMGVK